MKTVSCRKSLRVTFAFLCTNLRQQGSNTLHQADNYITSAFGGHRLLSKLLPPATPPAPDCINTAVFTKVGQQYEDAPGRSVVM